jgi:hypothetical protein
MYSVNVKNTYGIGSQAIAFSQYGSKVGVYACGFYEYQDTLLTNAGAQVYLKGYIEVDINSWEWPGVSTRLSRGQSILFSEDMDQRTSQIRVYISSFSSLKGYQEYHRRCRRWVHHRQRKGD